MSAPTTLDTIRDQQALTTALMILASTFVTATVFTASGNAYVVVTRSGITTAIGSRGEYAGKPMTADTIGIDAHGRLVLWRDGRCVLQSTEVVAVAIHEN